RFFADLMEETTFIKGVKASLG
ncbi:MAG: hypothetical protein RLZZ188_2350, partial [Verrucomicrobiota bacterium]